MEITYMGLVLIPVGVIFLFLKMEYLLLAVIFFSGFTGSSVINFESISFSLQPSYYFGMLFIVKYALSILLKDKKLLMPNEFLVLFVFFSFVSLIMPILLEHRNVEVLSPDGFYTQVKFGLQNITQFLYLLFCFIFYWLTKDYIGNDYERIIRLLKAFLYGGLVVCLLGFYQETAYILGLPFDIWFRSGVHGNVQPYGNFVRMYSVANEPSMFAMYLAPLLVLSLFVNKKIYKYKATLIFLSIISGILSTSTTFVLGIIIFAMLFIYDKVLKPYYNIEDLKILKYFGFSISVLFIICSIAFVLSPQVKYLLTTNILEKFSGSNLSGSERISSLIHHFIVGLNYPLLGVGFGAARSKDLFTTLLANVGVFCTSILVIYVIYMRYKLNRIKNYEISQACQGISYYLTIIFVIMFVSVSELYYLYLWVIIAIAEGLLKVNQQKQV
jgi:hypothetical protein